MQTFDIYNSRAAYEDRVAELKKDYASSKNKPARKPLNWLKKVLKRNDV